MEGVGFSAARRNSRPRARSGDSGSHLPAAFPLRGRCLLRDFPRRAPQEHPAPSPKRMPAAFSSRSAGRSADFSHPSRAQCRGAGSSHHLEHDVPRQFAGRTPLRSGHLQFTYARRAMFVRTTSGRTPRAGTTGAQSVSTDRLGDTTDSNDRPELMVFVCARRLPEGVGRSGAAREEQRRVVSPLLCSTDCSSGAGSEKKQAPGILPGPAQMLELSVTKLPNSIASREVGPASTDGEPYSPLT